MVNEINDQEYLDSVSNPSTKKGYKKGIKEREGKDTRLLFSIKGAILGILNNFSNFLLFVLNNSI